MAGRIITLQRQARELGRLRAGTVEATRNGRTRPARSKTWILTTHQRAYLETAAELWGGEVTQWTPQGGGAPAWRLITTTEAIDAILPPGDPLSQSYELWSRGGCQRRCDGETEQLSGKPCLCRKEFGEDFFLQPPDQACRPHTRLNVILPDVPDLGVWRMETKGYYAANEIAASIDMIRSSVPPTAMVPIRLRIEPRKRVAAGQTKQFPVIVVEIRGATAGQILSGNTPAIEIAAPERSQAIEAGPAGEAPKAINLIRMVGAARNQQQLELIPVRDVAQDDPDIGALREAWQRKVTEFSQPVAQVVAEEIIDAEPEPDADAVWAQIMTAVPQSWGTEGLEQRVIAALGKPSIDANGFELQRFLELVKAGGAA